MAKAFTENEMEIIRQKLIESCRICWEKYGYKKTNVAELCAMSNISAGAFYAFFPSKEMLFVTTANHFTEKIYGILRSNKPEQPTKYDLIKSFGLIIEELAQNKWIFSIRGDYEVFLRKLPKDFLAQEYRKDLFDIAEVIKLYELTPKFSIEEITSVVYTIVLSLYFADTIGEHHKFACGLLINAVFEKLFE